MFCGGCNSEVCTFEVIKLTTEDISSEYIDSLNDKTHLVHSRNVVNTYTHESQVAYIQSFDFDLNFILGVVCSKSKKIIATATLIVGPSKQSVNIGILIFKSYANRGYGHLILEKISNFCFELFPGYSQEVGTRFENYAMRKIALKVGFEFSKENRDCDFIYFVRTSILQGNLKFLRESPLLVIANDAGGSAHLAAMLQAFNISPPTRLSGPAIGIFNRFGIESKEITISSRLGSSQYILVGTSFFGGPESLALSDPAFSGISKIALLDHWVNYRERFHPTGKILPELFLVTNNLALLKAKEHFPGSTILEIPDFQLAFMKRAFLKKVKDPHTALILLEPEFETAFSARYPQVNLDRLVSDVRGLARERQIERIILRPHPAHSPAFARELLELFLPTDGVSVSKNLDLIDDLLKADFVVGFHTYALYLASELGIQTFGYFTQETEHWTHNFIKISPIGIKS